MFKEGAVPGRIDAETYGEDAEDYTQDATQLDTWVFDKVKALFASAKGDPELDALFQKQARERDPKQREALLHELQRLVHERGLFAPIYETAGLSGIGPRVAESGLGLIPTYNWSGPYEDVRLK